MSFNLDSVIAEYSRKHPLCDNFISLCLYDIRIIIKSNSAKLLSELNYYFRHLLTTKVSKLTDQEITIVAIQDSQVSIDLPFVDWHREAGKSGRKESIYDLNNPATRIIHKTRSGMYFIQSQVNLYALGPCEENPNQIINFINNQYLNHLQQNDSILCHASALVHHGQALAFAGLSGGGKSTLMLHLLEASHCQFLSNDRVVVIQNNKHETTAYGIPKLPRVNPGTLLNQASLTSLLTKERQQQLHNMPRDQLWQLEEKYDVDIEAWLGKGQIQHYAPLTAFIILNWSLDSELATQLTAVSITERQDLLPAIMKSYGPFYQYRDGHFLTNGQDVEKDNYLKHLSAISFYELSGKINFSTAVKLIQTQLLQN